MKREILGGQRYMRTWRPRRHCQLIAIAAARLRSIRALAAAKRFMRGSANRRGQPPGALRARSHCDHAVLLEQRRGRLERTSAAGELRPRRHARTAG